MKIGAEPKKVAILGALLAFAGYQFVANWGPPAAPSPGPSASPAPARSAPVQPASQADATRSLTEQRRAERPARRASNSRTLREFRPILRAQASLDAMTLDPSLRLDLLEKVRGVSIQSASRNLFQFGTKPVEPVKEMPKLPSVAKIIPNTPGAGGDAAPAAKPSEPPPPPISLQYYGYTQKMPRGEKRALFLDGEEIFVATEGDIVKKRYKIVRIGINSVVVEDTASKREQTVRIVDEVG